MKTRDVTDTLPVSAEAGSLLFPARVAAHRVSTDRKFSSVPMIRSHRAAEAMALSFRLRLHQSPIREWQEGHHRHRRFFIPVGFARPQLLLKNLREK